jgi:hypothetical protein
LNIWVRGWATAACLAFALGCTDKGEKPAKRRIFSPEDPPKVVASALENLEADKLDSNPTSARRVLQMGAAETTERIGPYQFKASTRFHWTAGSKSIQLSENQTLIAGPGGVNGDFQGQIENSEDQGLEVVRVGSAVYARNRYGKFRQRQRDRGMAEREREEIFGALRGYDMLFLGRLKLSSGGATKYHGRSAWKYTVGLAPEGNRIEQVGQLPPLPFPKGGMDPSTARRSAFWDERQPKSLKGEITVDQKTAVVLQARLDGRMIVPPARGNPGAELQLTLESALTDIGVDPALKPPKDSLPDADKPLGIAAALDRFGIHRGGRGAADGGVVEEEEEER